MSGFFGFFDFTKPGPGVPEDEPEKRRFFMYFIYMRRRLWKLTQLNLIYFITIIPALIIYHYVSGFIVSEGELTAWLSKGVADYNETDMLLSTIITRGAFAFFMAATLGAGPFTAGFAYIIRNFSRGEHAWVWSDFWEHTWKNIKQSSAVFIIDIALIIISSQSVRFYALSLGDAPVFRPILAAIGVFWTLFIMAHFYVYPMMVTYKLSLGDIYKNAVILSLMRLIPNVLILALIMWVILFCAYFTKLGVFLMILFGLSFMGYTIYFYACGVLEKVMHSSADNAVENPSDGADNEG